MSSVYGIFDQKSSVWGGGSQVDNQTDRHLNLLAGSPIFFGGGKKNCGMGVKFLFFTYFFVEVCKTKLRAGQKKVEKK